MGKRRFLALAIVLAAWPLLGANCGTGPSDGGAGGSDAAPAQDAAGDHDGGGGPAGHSENLSGAWHMPGKEDPLANCASCHGNALAGGSGPSCYDCHDNSDHSTSYNGVPHRSGSSGSCSTCHGPGNGGGLGPACSSCHF
ncbi:MAG: hypothetical protein JXR83_06000 [Deltaproteobacteria bacterium]|nr:hypothetical protein [Deltaproteobacteria bacterium]